MYMGKLLNIHGMCLLLIEYRQNTGRVPEVIQREGPKTLRNNHPKPLPT